MEKIKIKNTSTSEIRAQNWVKINEEHKKFEQDFSDITEQVQQSKVYSLPVVHHNQAQRYTKLK